MGPAPHSILRDAWTCLLDDAGAAPDASASTFADVCERYSSPGRYYHALDHVRAVLQTVQLLAGDPVPALSLAAWLHDVIYDSRARDNEEQSAAYARRLLRPLGVAEVVLAETERLILLTKTHEPGPTDRHGAILVDADLAILGASAHEYDAYAWAIRREYGWVPEAEYRMGRGAVLRAFLERPRIYRTEELFARIEGTARGNLRREVQSLG